MTPSAATGHDVPPSPRDERVAVAGGLGLAVRRWPAGDVPPVRSGHGPGSDAVPFVLVHGLASNARTWDGVAARLAGAGHEVVALDLRGHGRSDKPDDGYEVATVAADVRDAIAALGLARPVVAGQSWGGNVVVELGARHPEAVRGVVGVDGGLIDLGRRFPDWTACAAELAPPRLAGTPLREIEAWFRRVHGDWPESGIAGTLANFELHPDGTVAPWLTFERHMTVLRGLWAHHPIGLLAGGYPVPLLLALADGGDGWSAEKRALAEEACGLDPAIRVEWFPGADHDIHAERPAELAGLLLRAIDDGWLAGRSGGRVIEAPR